MTEEILLGSLPARRVGENWPGVIVFDRLSFGHVFVDPHD